MTHEVEDVVIVGGGDVGLLTALTFDAHAPEMDVRVVDDFDEDVSQVGTSTYLEIQNILHGVLDIDEIRFISEVKPIWKSSLYFRDWCGDRFHYTFDSAETFMSPDTDDVNQWSQYHYEEAFVDTSYRTRGGEIAEQQSSPWYYGDRGDLSKYEKFAYHLNTERFVPFLRDLCRERGVTLVDDRVERVETTGQTVDAVEGADGRYEADLFVDATGFTRLLRSEQDAEFREFDFPLDSAVSTQVERPLSEAEPATVLRTGDHGWFWQIDTHDYRDLGYVFGSEYASDEEARAEFVEYVENVSPEGCDPDLAPDELTTHAFNSGYYDRSWVDNCLCIGNAEGFVEPLQSTALTANTWLAVQLAQRIGSNDRVVTDDLKQEYNMTVANAWESIYDFITVHYTNASGETEFWEAAASIPVSGRVERIRDLFDRRGFDLTLLTEHEQQFPNMLIFNAFDFFEIMHKLGATSEYHETNDVEVRDGHRQAIDESYTETREVVSEYHLGADEFYRGVLRGLN